MITTDQKFMQCPYYIGHLVGHIDSVGACKLNEYRPCQKELGETCQEWDEYGREVLDEQS